MTIWIGTERVVISRLTCREGIIVGHAERLTSENALICSVIELNS